MLLIVIVNFSRGLFDFGIPRLLPPSRLLEDLDVCRSLRGHSWSCVHVPLFERAPGLPLGSRLSHGILVERTV